MGSKFTIYSCVALYIYIYISCIHININKQTRNLMRYRAAKVGHDLVEHHITDTVVVAIQSYGGLEIIKQMKAAGNSKVAISSTNISPGRGFLRGLTLSVP